MRLLGLATILAFCAAFGLARGGALPVAQRVASNDGTYVVEYTLEPAEVPLNERFSVVVSVLDGSEGAEPAGDVSLALDARMPHHRHGMRVEPTVTRLDDGRWRVEGLLFHMPGRWELYFDVTRGAVTERAQEVIELE